MSQNLDKESILNIHSIKWKKIDDNDYHYFIELRFKFQIEIKTSNYDVVNGNK